MKLTESKLRSVIKEVLGSPSSYDDETTSSFLDDAYQELLRIRVQLSKFVGIATKNNALKLAEDVAKVRDSLNEITRKL